MAVRRGVSAHLRHQPLRRRRAVLDRFPVRRPRRDRRPGEPGHGGAPPRGTYVYPDGPAARNGADIFRVAIGLTDTDTWWRVDWNTLLDPSVPIALFTFDTDRATTTTDEWPAGAGVRSAGIDLALLVSASGARLIDLTTHASTPVEHTVDMSARSFLARVPRSLVEPDGTWTVRLAAGLANDVGDGFADVPLRHGAKPGQPNVYNVAFRTHEQEKPHLNFWSDAAQAEALADGDVSQFSLAVPWDALADRLTTDEPVVTGASTRWYVSSIELGQGVADTAPLSTDPVFLGRVQPYSVCLPATYAPGRTLPLTLLLHSLALGQNQFAAIGPRLLHQICEDRDSVVVTPLARGPSCWYLDEGELDVWEVWARVAEQLGTDPNRTVISGYSMGGYGAYKLALAYPEVFAQAVVLAGPPDVRRASCCPMSTFRATWTRNRTARARATPCGYSSTRGGFRSSSPTGCSTSWCPCPRSCSRFTSWTGLPTATGSPSILATTTSGGCSRTTSATRCRTWVPGPGRATPDTSPSRGFPQLVRPDLGIGPHQVWWLSDLAADPDTTASRGATASVDARSHARPDPTRTTRRRRGFEPDLDLTPGLYTEVTWRIGPAVAPLPSLALNLTRVAGLTVDVARAGLAALSSSAIKVRTDTLAQIKLAALPPDTTVLLDGRPSGPAVAVPVGQHTITLTR